MADRLTVATKRAARYPPIGGISSSFTARARRRSKVSVAMIDPVRRDHAAHFESGCPVWKFTSRSMPRPNGKRTLASSNRLKLRSEEHTSELQSLMRISYAVFCLKKNNNRELWPRQRLI